MDVIPDEVAGEPAQAAAPHRPDHRPDRGPGHGPGRVPEPTGDRRVDDALARLAGLEGVPVSGHVEVFEEVHRRLQELLTSADQDDPGPPAAPGPRPGPVPGPSGPRPGPSGPRPGPPGPPVPPPGPYPGRRP
ncbi:hypothetical protein ACFY4C_10835 [Actinomadura viridis]|uniref:hypothetical protein n=1 Tax=Actinomadura viridis TaxID=58110 RepID=UPI0036A8938A